MQKTLKSYLSKHNLLFYLFLFFLLGCGGDSSSENNATPSEPPIKVDPSKSPEKGSKLSPEDLFENLIAFLYNHMKLSRFSGWSEMKKSLEEIFCMYVLYRDNPSDAELLKLLSKTETNLRDIQDLLQKVRTDGSYYYSFSKSFDHFIYKTYCYISDHIKGSHVKRGEDIITFKEAIIYIKNFSSNYSNKEKEGLRENSKDPLKNHARKIYEDFYYLTFDIDEKAPEIEGMRWITMKEYLKRASEIYKTVFDSLISKLEGLSKSSSSYISNEYSDEKSVTIKEKERNNTIIKNVLAEIKKIRDSFRK